MKRVGFYLYQVQDVDLVLPVALEFEKRKVGVVFYLAAGLKKTSPRVHRILKQHEFKWREEPWSPSLGLLLSKVGWVWPIFSEVDALFTAAETTAKAHNLGRRLTVAANQMGKPTYTLQHGFENIGLTYEDNEYPASKVGFNSTRIFTWHFNDRFLLSTISVDTLKKVTPVGYTKCDYAFECENPFRDHFEKRIGIFENLHWSRYSEAYREKFVETVLALAHKFPLWAFVLKSHHAGKWFQRSSLLNFKTPANVQIIDFSQGELELLTANYLIKFFDAVITTPSTVAVDAAFQKKPTAVFIGDLQSTKYHPLLSIKGVEDALAFARHLSFETGSLVELSEQFFNRACLPQGASQRIVDVVMGDLK